MENNERLEWAKQLFEEWQYRHEAFYKTLYRYAWVFVILAVLPAIGVVKEVKKALPQIPDFSTVSTKYCFLIVAVFIGANLHLAVEYRHQKGIERQLKELRGAYRPIKLTKLEFLKEAGIPTLLWTLGWLLFFVAAFRIFFNTPPTPAG